ncbi:hypothetical protein CRUP_029819 [Coryphaenoides rupestris]|nr:hypothetical protein CRUP_029819 [Coryphaenoides rupestris]
MFSGVQSNPAGREEEKSSRLHWESVVLTSACCCWLLLLLLLLLLAWRVSLVPEAGLNDRGAHVENYRADLRPLTPTNTQ